MEFFHTSEALGQIFVELDVFASNSLYIKAAIMSSSFSLLGMLTDWGGL